MNARLLIASTAAAAALALGGCATGPSGQQIGTVGGAVVGGAVGNAVSGGNAIGTVGGAAAGALIGNEIGRRNDYNRGGYYQTQPGYAPGYQRGYYERPGAPYGPSY
ncbi:glycine zipper 2TM domain-containing protein [Variovorax sp.]|uniref:glycine zipper 2TM domain-containing protein n=1 Tax=Variovorax sp. TaxID=1871043 RepID=UPI002D341BBE|nr:glycine zipper 2TM domain-containing protein [Variovorax sp.]HYP83897.1 glycine zipper 2TM domain-containing protein [Variovorax sp.]